MTAQQAIARSISHNEIVTLDYDSDEYHALLDTVLEADNGVSDWVEANEVTEFWGETEDGDDWRVHMRHEVKRGAGYYAIDTGDGNELCNGLAPEIARKVAQRHANERGESVYLYEVGSDDEAEEIEPDDVSDEHYATDATRDRQIDADLVRGKS